MSNQQPDLQPPNVKPPLPPSWKTYFLLVLVSIALIIITFYFGEPDWSGLIINLASGVMTTVMFLIIIEKKFRRNEFYDIIHNSNNRILNFVALFSNNVSDTLAYAKILEKQILSIHPKEYIKTRMNEIELKNFPKGFILIGMAGIGKTTFIQYLAYKYSKKLSKKPFKTPIPVIISMSQWQSGNMIQQIFNTVYNFYPVRLKVFQKWIRKKPMLLIFDGFDEAQKPLRFFDEIKNLQKIRKNIQVIVTSRTAPNTSLLPQVTMGEFTKQQTKQQINLILGSLENKEEIIDLFHNLTNGHALANGLLLNYIQNKKIEKPDDAEGLMKVLKDISLNETDLEEVIIRLKDSQGKNRENDMNDIPTRD